MKKTLIIIIAAVVIGAGIFCAIFFLKEFNVTFYSNDGTVLSTQQVRRFGSATAPADPITEYGEVFTGWSEDFSSVNSDLDIHAACESFRGRKNVLAVSSGYGKKDETVSIPVQLCGDVSTSAFDICITYDTSLLKYEGSSEDDGGIVINEGEPGKIYLNYVSLDNTTGDVDLCMLNFTPIVSSGESPVEIGVTSIYEVVNDELVETDYDVINSTIHIIG